jgi:hypothetical protein
MSFLKKETEDEARKAVEDQELYMDDLVRKSAENIDAIVAEGVEDRVEQFARFAMATFKDDEEEPFEREWLMSRLITALFRLGEGYRSVRDEKQDQAAQIVELFDGNRRHGPLHQID